MLRLPVISRVLTIFVLLGLLLFPAASVFASNGATSYTQTDQNVTNSFPFLIPCLNAPAMATITYNDVFHTNINNAGDYWITGTLAGTFVGVPADATLPTYSGHFATWFGENDNNKNSNTTVTLSMQLTGTDGSMIHANEVAHFGVSATGVVVSFDKPVCN